MQSRVFSVGNGVLWAEAGVGAVATQAIVDVSYGPKGIALLKEGLAPGAIIKRILDEDPDPGYRGNAWPKAGRQFAVMNAKGEFAAHTGPQASTWAGHKQGRSAPRRATSSPGQMSSRRWSRPSSSPRRTRRDAAAISRCGLVAALEAGQAAGGDTRGQQSAALIVVKKDAGVWLNNDVVLRLQVDDNPEPIKELRRLVERSPAGRTGGRGRGGQ